MRTTLLLVALLVSGTQALAQHQHGNAPARPMQENHHNHTTAPSSATQSSSPSTKAYAAANDKMHRDMNVPFTGDADADFVRGMIPHHQGAVDMAKIVLQYGADPDIKKMAEEIIAAQEKEIAFFRAWLARKQK